MKIKAAAKRGRRYAGRIFILAVLLLVIGIIGFSCVEGMTAIGWSGGAVAENTLFVGTREGRMVAVDTTDESRQWTEKLVASGGSGGLFGCMPAGGSCAAGASGVAIYGTPTFTDELVYLAGYNGKVYAFARETLLTRWIYPREGYFHPIVGGLAIADDKVFLNKYYGFCLYHLGRYPEAIEHLQIALESSPRYTKFKKYLKRLTYENKMKEIGDIDARIEEMEEMMIKESPSLTDHTSLGMLYIFKGEFKKAEDLLVSYKKNYRDL